MKLVGLSVSLCIKDIIDGKVEANNVEYIVGSTKGETAEDWKQIASTYARTYWKKKPEVGIALLEGFLWQNKIEQPRVTGDKPPSITHGHWVISSF